MAIRVLIAEDSPVVQVILRRMLATYPDIELVGMAGNGKEALRMLPQVLPDVVCTDFHMPEMNGLELTQEIMATMPRPILILSASVQAEDTQNVFRVLKAGAVDVLPKPINGGANNWQDLQLELITKIRVLSGVAVFTHRRQLVTENQRDYSPVVTPLRSKQVGQNSVPTIAREVRQRIYELVAIGASTGGPQALQGILQQIPPGFPVPIVCVQHISRGFLTGLVNWLNTECRVPVRIAQPGMRAEAGVIYFPPEDQHLTFSRPGVFATAPLPPFSGHRPSVTVTFESVAQVYGRRCVAILLTGMGKDGALGMQAVSQAGGVTIAQDEATSVVFGMPKEAIALGAAQYILPLPDIAPVLLKRLFVG
ncbi:chemotaxis-specific protein-glutamate methyltransferase CheB [Geitlerinema sp. P-1104]|uniref:chemotaxis-specific protein-glutamate methyltransferase CheB n=1 Tax=Geitlerinema sp. P-1104 TaxID=2546230 RepID=UPI0014770614|nr:chemotaxis-specific protein-glutamate methyltransferase CheB [Geitlerinema sp. P-1104]NMG58908.1 chemotaxis-specific protein-glutamate methyltransferase CheB [Geitlerinema sp. P-1104]